MSSNSGTPVTSPIHAGRSLNCKVLMLDDTVQNFPIPLKGRGIDLFNAVIKKLQLIECDYFDLQYNNPELIPCWLDHEKPILKQVTRNQLFFKFLLKFYTPDPGLLEEEFTRYLLALQIKRDLLSGDLYCQEHTAVLLASYIVQAELGNYCDEYASQSYISQLHLLPNQTPEIELQIMEHHKEHMGQSPAEADFNLLDTARKVELYGIQLHSAQDHDGANLHLSVSHSGILVFQNYTKINSFSWAKIRKLCFKRKKFLVKLHSEGMEGYKDVVEFYFPSRNWSKNFWKKCIEHHTFFRCHTVHKVPRSKTKVISHGSSFRYSGRTQKELVDFAREKSIKPVPFERTTSMRTMSALQSRTGSPKTGTLTSRDIGFFHNHNPVMYNTQSYDRRQHPHNYMQQQQFQHFQSDAQSERGILESALKSYQLPSLHHQQQPMLSMQQQQTPNEMTYSHDQENINALQMLDGTNSWRVAHGLPLKLDADKSSNVYTSQSRIDPSQFMLGRLPVRASEPLLNDSPQHFAGQVTEEAHLSRTEEVEDIPVTVEDNVSFMQQHDTNRNISLSPLHHSVSDAAVKSRGVIETSVDDLLPLYSPGHIEVDEFVSSPRRLPATNDHKLNNGGNYSAKEFQPQDSIQQLPANNVAYSPEGLNLSVDPQVSQLNKLTSLSLAAESCSDDEAKKKANKVFVDVHFYLAKEFLMTERTYKKDLNVITLWFREAMEHEETMPDYLTSLFFSTIFPISEFHSQFLKQLEERMMAWESKSMSTSKDQKRIGDLLLGLISSFELYKRHFECQQRIMIELDSSMQQYENFERTVNEFEAEKICFLPLNVFILRPAQRLIYYKQILEKMISTMPGANHPDMSACLECLDKLLIYVEPLIHDIVNIVNTQKLIELQRGLVNIEDLLHAKRLFLREGCLQKHSKKGGQQRMFFLFSDKLVYASRLAAPLQFRVHGQMSLNGMMVTCDDPKVASIPHSFVIYTQDNKCIVVSTANDVEKVRWIEDLKKAIENYQSYNANGDTVAPSNAYSSLKSNSSSEALDESVNDDNRSPSIQHNVIQHRANNTMHVCWHRNTSVSLQDHCVALENQLSGYLLRKFKNSNGWQKLWVVFTNFCLFFYKNYQDDFPLASLPLLNYMISTPSENDNINKDFVFKLQFKNHVYFFRAESHVTFSRWMEVIGQVTITTRVLCDAVKDS